MIGVPDNGSREYATPGKIPPRKIAPSLVPENFVNQEDGHSFSFYEQRV